MKTYIIGRIAATLLLTLMTACIAGSQGSATLYECTSDGQKFTFPSGGDDPATLASLHITETTTCSDGSSTTQQVGFVAKEGMITLTCKLKSVVCSITGETFSVIQD